MTGSTIAQHARDYLMENGLSGVMWGDCEALDAIADRAGIGEGHPLDRWKSVLDGLGRAPDVFDKHYIETDCFPDGRSRNVRSFTLRDGD